MELADAIVECFEKPVFYVGILAGLFLYYALTIWKKVRLTEKRQALLRETKVVSDLFVVMDAGDTINIEDYFHETKRKNIVYSARYNAWRTFVYWIAYQCATYSYSNQAAENILTLGELCFGAKSISYRKLVAAEAIINYSPKLFLDENRKLFKNKKVEEFDELFDLIDTIIASTYVDKY